MKLNVSKSEFGTRSDTPPPQNLKECRAISLDDCELLGVPYGLPRNRVAAVLRALEESEPVLTAIEKFAHKQTALLLFRRCIVPRFAHLARAFPVEVSLEAFRPVEERFQAALCRIIGVVSLPSGAWKQATLPLRLGGLGIQLPSFVAPAARFAAIASSLPRLRKMIPSEEADAFFGELLPTDALRSCLNCSVAEFESESPKFNRQRNVAGRLFQNLHSELLGRLSEVQRARFLSVSTSAAAGFVEAVPIAAFGLRLESREFTIALCLRLGLPVIPNVAPGPLCQLRKCKAPLDTLGHHCISCKSGGHVVRRHNSLVRTIERFVSALPGSSTKFEKSLSESLSSRPGDLWCKGVALRCHEYYLDVTVVNPSCQSMCARSSKVPLAAALSAEETKSRKYEEEFELLEPLMELKPVFIPIAIECFGSFGPSARKFFQTLSNATSTFNSSPFQGRLQSLLQAVSVTLQRCNGSMIALSR
jgi:hypothetical protein